MRPWILLATLLLLVPPVQAVVAPDLAPDGVFAPASDTPAAIRATLALTAATTYNDADGDKLFDSLEAHYLEDPVQPVVVTFVEGASVDGLMAQVHQLAPTLQPRYVYHAYGGFAADLDLATATAVAALAGVRQVEWSQPGTLELDTATLTMNVRTVQDELDVTGDIDGAGISGNDTIIAILDTGFHGGHKDLEGKFVRFIDWSDDGKEKEPYDGGTHGTHVASIAAGLGKADPAYTGVAPGAAIVGFRITSKDDAIASIDHLLEHRDTLPVDILTISFGFGFTVDGTDALELAMDKAWESGITTFKSTGNSGPNRGTVTIPGGARGIIGTASMYDTGEGGFRLSSYSSRGPTADGRLKPDIAAPGSNIMAADARTDDGYVSFSGTSMASPFAAGVAALLKSVDRELTPDDVRRILAATAEDWGPAGHDVDYGNGRLDALRAVQLVALEKAVRDGLGADWLATYNVTGVELPGHQHGVLADGAATFSVEDATQPLALTLIGNHSVESPALALNGFSAVVRDPDGLIVATLEAGGLGDVPSFGLGFDPRPARQQTLSVVPTQTGTYTIEVRSGLHAEILWDVTAGLPPVDIAGVLDGSAALLEDSVGLEEREAPGLPLVVGLLALVGVALRRRLH